MKYLFVLAVIAVVAAIATCGPVDTDADDNPIRSDRHRRLTCDLLSFKLPKFAVNDSACAAHCLGMLKGYRGGSCKNGVCHCRR